MSKAEALAQIRDELGEALVPPFLSFAASAWKNERAHIVAAARGRPWARVAVRSSARREDGSAESLAGRFRTVLDVPNESTALAAAIDDVVASLPGEDGDQVLLQEMVSDVVASGVIFDRDPDTAAAYDLIEYDDASGRTDRVTAGRGGTKRIAVHRSFPSKELPRAWMAEVRAVVRRVERMRAGPLDLEWAKPRSGPIRLLQARPLAMRVLPSEARDLELRFRLARLESRFDRLAAPQPGIAGHGTILGQMPDWNPAELIGFHPAPLAASVYRWLLTDEVWQGARAGLGYTPVAGRPLVVLLAGRPYVDVRASFNSFVPASVPIELRGRIVDAWLDRLRARPDLHDAVEFEVAHTVLDFDFAETVRERYGGVLDDHDVAAHRRSLRELTDRAFSDPGSLTPALRTLSRLERAPASEPDGDNSLRSALAALAICRRLGALPFAVVARHAFMAEALLRSAVSRGGLEERRLAALRSSLRTVASDLSDDFAAVLGGRLALDVFHDRYGHLRPGTFDIASLPYRLRDDLFLGCSPAPRTRPSPEPFRPTHRELAALGRLCSEAGLSLSGRDLLHRATAAIVGRERAKFVFSRQLSTFLERVATWGEALALGREDLSFLTLRDLRSAAAGSSLADLRTRIEARRRIATAESRVRLGHLVRDRRDLYVIEPPACRPTFVTTLAISGAPVRIEPRMHVLPDLSGRIACIESADPGFDWIFARGIGGLVTRFGGGNSHMAIRCRELGVPAALGVGEELFERLAAAHAMELRCREGVVRSVWPSASA